MWCPKTAELREAYKNFKEVGQAMRSVKWTTAEEHDIVYQPYFQASNKFTDARNIVEDCSHDCLITMRNELVAEYGN